MKKRTLGWLLIGIIWSGIGLRFMFPADLHGSYAGLLHFVIKLIDWVFIMPAWLFLSLLMPPDRAPWLFFAGTGIYLLGLHVLIVKFLIKKR